LELAQFNDYEAVFGRTAPPVAGITQALEAASQWTALLADSSEWLGYVKSQEGMAWKDTLTLVDNLKAPFELASTHDPSLLSRYPSLARLLGAAKVIAKRGAATRKRNATASGGSGGGTGTQPAAPEPPAPVAPAPPAAITPAGHAQ
jgi:hypothetical protein